MPHMMEDFPLLLSTLYDGAVRLYPEREIVSVEADRASGGPHTARPTTESAGWRPPWRAPGAGAGGEPVGPSPGTTVATTSSTGHRQHRAVCHTINIRLFADQIAYIVNHAEDGCSSWIPTWPAARADRRSAWRRSSTFVVMGDDASGFPNAIAYEDLIEGVEPHGAWPVLDERSPDDVLLHVGHHRQPQGRRLHPAVDLPAHHLNGLANFPIGAGDNVLPVVPMFHAAGMGLPVLATTAGAKITYPGPDLSPKGVVDLIEKERGDLLRRGADGVAGDRPIPG